MQTEELKNIVLAGLNELKASDVSVLDVTDRTSVTDYMIIASGTSSRHVRSLAENVVAEVKEHGGHPLGVEGGTNADWVLVDLGAVVVHVMMPATREFYDLERFWKDAPRADEVTVEN
jgi:ribosome-associated protein